MPKRWSVVLTGGPVPVEEILNAPQPAADSVEVEADDLQVNAGALVFVAGGVVKKVVSATAYSTVDRLEDTPRK